MPTEGQPPEHLYIHPLPKFEMRPDKWLGVSFGSGRIDGNPYDIPLVGLVLADHQYALDISSLILSWTEGETVDQLKRIRVAVIEDTESSYIFFCHPNVDHPAAERFFQSLDRSGDQDDSHPRQACYILFLGKRCEIGPASRYEWFRDRYQEGVPIMLEFVVAQEDGSLQNAQEARSLVVFDVRFVRIDELEATDPLFHVLRLKECNDSFENDYSLGSSESSGSAWLRQFWSPPESTTVVSKSDQVSSLDSQNKTVSDYQRSYFSILDEFFRRLAGKPASAFSDIEEAQEASKIHVEQYGKAGANPYEMLVQGLSALYGKHAAEVARIAIELPGLKAVMGGGSSRFTKSHLEAVRRILLYVDTVLLPDPILPWLEVERSEEKFPLIWVFRTCYFLLQLKPLIDADLPYPCVLVFPAWEKTKEEDIDFRSSICQVTVDAVSNELGLSLQTISELGGYARDNEREFLSAVEARRLFLAPGGEVGEPLDQAISRYREDRRRYNQGKYLDSLGLAGNGALIAVALMEAFTPQFHVLSHAEELQAAPVLPTPFHEHYYRLCSRVLEERLRAVGLLESRTICEIHALNRKDFAWLTNVPISDLVLLRAADENASFRSALREHFANLHEAHICDIDRVASEISRAIGSLLAAHKREAAEIEERYSRRHTGTAMLGWAALGAALVPSLAPFVAPVAPLALLAKYTTDKREANYEMKKKSKSLMGIMASAIES